MLILTEKPSVAKEFASALSGYSGITITNCLGHLFNLEEPAHYSAETFPVIPERFDYCINPSTVEQTKRVLQLLQAHKNDNILIATDADREGEIIARECLTQAGINHFSKKKSLLPFSVKCPKCGCAKCISPQHW